MNFKKWIFVLCSLIASFFLVACQSSSSSSQSAVEAIKQKGKLVVATSPDYAPFEFQSLVDGKNQVVGADIDMAQAIADELGVKLEVSSMSFDNVLTSLQTGKAAPGEPPPARLCFSRRKAGTLSSGLPPCSQFRPD